MIFIFFDVPVQDSTQVTSEPNSSSNVRTKGTIFLVLQPSSPMKSATAIARGLLSLAQTVVPKTSTTMCLKGR